MIRAMGKPYESMVVMVTGAVLSIILSWLFVIVLNLGVAGAALSTILAQAVALVFALYILLRKKNTTLRFKIRSVKFNPTIMFTIISVGISPFLAQVVGSVVVALMNNTLRTHGEAVISGGGDLAIGAMGIIANFLMLFFMPIFGLNQGSQPILGYNYGAKQYDRVKETLKYTISSAALVSFIGWCFVIFFRQVPIGLFTAGEANNPELIQMAMSGMPIFAGAFFLVGAQLIMAMFFQAIGKARIALMLSMLRQVILFIPLLLILPRSFGLNGVWFSGLIADIVAFSVTALIFTYTIRAKLRNIP